MRLRNLLVSALLFLAVGMTIASAGSACAQAPEMQFRKQEGTEGGSWMEWVDRYLNLLPGEGASGFRGETSSCAGRGCPTGLQCCCCGDRCSCKQECSFQPCR